MSDSPREYCGLFGVYGHPEAARLVHLGLYALQHRGEESAGIVTSDGQQLFAHKGMGLVGDVFVAERMRSLPGHLAIGHVRYSTTGSSHLRNAQPLLDDVPRCSVAVAHNGNLINTAEVRAAMEARGAKFQTTVNSEIILQFLAKAAPDELESRLLECVRTIKGAFSLVILTDHSLIGVRDPNGFRPLCLGQLDHSWILASETCALDLIGATFVREVAPGEIVWITGDGLRSLRPFAPDEVQPSYCIFEHVYFARPDSIIFGEQVEVVRYRLGKELAKEHPAKADLVMPVPDSGNFAALGFSHASGIPFAWGMIRNHYIGRTFIQPEQSMRDFKVRVKLNPLKSVLQGQRVVVVDDSIVRGTTSQLRIAALRQAGAKEIHMRISCPPTKHPCYYGIDFPSRKELIAANHTVAEIRDFLQAESLGYLSIDGLLRAVSGKRDQYCTACFSGKYPLPVPEESGKYVLETKC